MNPIQRQLIGPALALGAAGGISSLGAVLAWNADPGQMPAGLPSWFRQFLLLGPVVGLPLIWGAYLLARLEAYWYARLTCVLALIPCGIGSPLAIPAGIWGWLVLRRPSVRAAFTRRAEDYRAALEQALEEFDADLRDPES